MNIHSFLHKNKYYIFSGVCGLVLLFIVLYVIFYTNFDNNEKRNKLYNIQQLYAIMSYNSKGRKCNPFCSRLFCFIMSMLCI